uniref:Uncharacterized protein n=1 Tax=Ananas comosus var. bracteatus TaxID=296719 RepID=A0A6V7QL21_ANACO|nr:unnamed protein product [Ananas comosus var. bracteatus]
MGQPIDPLAVSPASADYRRLCSQFSRLGLFRPSRSFPPSPSSQFSRSPSPPSSLSVSPPPRSPTYCPAPSSASSGPSLAGWATTRATTPSWKGGGPGEERKARSLRFERAEGSVVAEARREGTKGGSGRPSGSARRGRHRGATGRSRGRRRRTTTRAAEEEEDESDERGGVGGRGVGGGGGLELEEMRRGGGGGAGEVEAEAEEAIKLGEEEDKLRD